MTKENSNRNAPFKIEIKRGVLAIEGTSAEFKKVSEDLSRIIIECNEFLKKKMTSRVIIKDFTSQYREVTITSGGIILNEKNRYIWDRDPQFSFSDNLGIDIDSALVSLLGPEPEPEKTEDVIAETLSQSQNVPLPLKAKKKHG